MLRWGRQLDLRPIRATEHGDARTDERVARYIAKYAAKGAEASGTVNRPLRNVRHLDRIQGLTTHARRMIETCWDLGGQVAFESCNLREWAHMLGYGGHFRPRAGATPRRWVPCVPTEPGSAGTRLDRSQAWTRCPRITRSSVQVRGRLPAPVTGTPARRPGPRPSTSPSVTDRFGVLSQTRARPSCDRFKLSSSWSSALPRGGRAGRACRPLVRAPPTARTPLRSVRPGGTLTGGKRPVPCARQRARRRRDVLAGRTGLQDGRVSASIRSCGRGPCHPDHLPKGYHACQGPQARHGRSRSPGSRGPWPA